MEVEYSENIIIPNKNFDLCDYFNKFPQISNAIIRIGNKDILVNKEMLMKYSEFFRNFITDNAQANNIYYLDTEYPINFIKKALAYLYGCELTFNINQFSIYYRIANYLLMDELTDNLRENIKEGFKNHRYDISQALRIVVDIFYIGDDELNEILLATIANNFMYLRKHLGLTDMNILQSIISRNDLNVDVESEVVFFLNQYYARYQNYQIEIDAKLVPNIRMLTLTLLEISAVSHMSLSELPTYEEMLNISYLSKKGDVASKRYLTINYPEISIPRNSVVIYQLNLRPEIKKYPFGKTVSDIFISEPRLPIFSAIITDITFGRLLELKITDNIIHAEINMEINMEMNQKDTGLKVGTMILVIDSLFITTPILNRDIDTGLSYNTCLINKYEIMFERVPKMFYR